MKHKIFIGLTLLVQACQNRQQDAMHRLCVVWERVAIQQEPDPEAREVARLGIGEEITDLAAVSSFVSRINYRDSLFVAPWIRVELSNGKTGWMFAPAARPCGEGHPEHWQEGKLFQAIFGPELFSEQARLTQSLRLASNDATLAQLFKESEHLARAMEHNLRSRPYRDRPDSDWSWVPGLLPWLVPQLAGDTAGLELYIDYAWWVKKATTTKGRQDDNMMAFLASLFPPDSVESRFPVWTFPLAIDASASLLGKGEHQKALLRIADLRKSCPEFSTTLDALYESVTEDILSPESVFWMAPEFAIEELKRLLQLPDAVVAEQDKLAFAEKIKLLEQPLEAGLRVNLRAGQPAQ